jgi:hypothetical protein
MLSVSSVYVSFNVLFDTTPHNYFIEVSMEPIEPWIYGLLELMKHAEEHQQANGEFDRRIALIGYDNAIEVSISTYLQLHPTQRGGVSYPNEQVNKWLMNYHGMLDFFFDEFMVTSDRASDVTKQTIIHYHSLRNDLYHKGKALVPTERDIQGAHTAAIHIFSTLFNTNGEQLLISFPPLHPGTTKKFNFQGSGNDLHKIPLEVGSTIIRFKYQGGRHIKISLHDENDRLIKRIVDPLGTFEDEEKGGTFIFQRGTHVNIRKAGIYFLKIQTLGTWEIEVEQ